MECQPGTRSTESYNSGATGKEYFINMCRIKLKKIRFPDTHNEVGRGAIGKIPFLMLNGPCSSKLHNCKNNRNFTLILMAA